MVFKLMLGCCLLLPWLTWAEVNPKNGNYMVTYEDLVQSQSGHTLNLRRTYNSRAPTVGWYGWGWGSPYETRVVALPDGSAVVLENGTGLKHYYDPQEDAADLSGSIRSLVQAATGSRSLSDGQASELERRLKADEDFRLATAMEFGVTGSPAVGKQWRSRRCGVLKRHDTGYERRDCNGGRDLFNERGELQSIEEAGGNKVELSYQGSRVSKVSDANGQHLTFEWTNAGRVDAVRSSNGGHVKYEYIADELRSMEGGRGERMNFVYDNAHRLTQATYFDTTSHKVEYNNDGLVSAVIGREGERTTYEYDEINKDLYQTRVTSINRDGITRERLYRYVIADRSDGVHLVDRMVEQNGNIEISRDGQGRILEVSIRGRTVEERGYDNGKIRFIKNVDTGTIQYSYDKGGDLVAAEHDRGSRITLRYLDGYVSEVDLTEEGLQKPWLIKYKYNSSRKLARIEVQEVGSVIINYKLSGEISTIESPENSDTTFKILSIMQSIDALINPSDVLSLL